MLTPSRTALRRSLVRLRQRGEPVGVVELAQGPESPGGGRRSAPRERGVEKRYGYALASQCERGARPESAAAHDHDIGDVYHGATRRDLQQRARRA